MKKSITITMMAVLLLMLIVALLAMRSFLSTEAGSSEGLEQLVRNELGKYIAKVPEVGECIYYERWLLHYDVPGKGVVDMGELRIGLPLGNFLTELASKPDREAYVKQVVQQNENPKQYPNATYVGGDPIDDINVTLAPNAISEVSYGSSNSKLSFAVSVGLWDGDEAQYTLMKLYVVQNSLITHQVWKRVFHFEQTNGVPGNDLSLMGYGQEFHVFVQNTDPTSQKYRIYRSLEQIP